VDTPAFISVRCPGCGKRLKAAGRLAGRRVTCPACRQPVQVPAAPAAAPPREPAAPAARSAADDWWDDLDPQTPMERVLATARQATTSAPVPPRAEPAGPGEPRPMPRGAPARWRSLVFLVVLIPLGLQMLGGVDDVQSRLEQTLEGDEEVVARVEELQERGDGAVDKAAIFGVLPGRRIVGAHLAFDSRLHWVYAAVAAAVFLALVRGLFDQGETTLLQLGGAMAITATAGVASLLMFQWFAAMAPVRIGGRGAILMIVVRLIAFAYQAALDPANGLLVSFIGFTVGVGLCEEFIKLAAVIGLMRRGRPDWRGACALGLASGVGFGVAEGIIYSASMYNGVASCDVYLTRFVSCVGLHAIWSGAAAVMAAPHGRSFESDEPVEVAITGLKAVAVPAVLHGLYDTLLKRDLPAAALATALVSFAWLAVMVWYARSRAAEDAAEAEAEGAG
jgi:RsiW-degrading membrane proteinase PrsW (M82 family)